MEKQLKGIVHETLFHIFLDVMKAYYSIDQWRYMEILREYGLGPRLQLLIQRYWDIFLSFGLASEVPKLTHYKVV